ncbi:MAG: CCA tRNA nucleotidyltransferase [Clostridia bacterium]|nr:CCA tRNA nucleotidyltransferase [Clostridia bacterium]
MNLTNGVKEIIKNLTINGYEAYAVGGAVRDFCLGKKIDDYDVTTSATPNEVLEVFKGYKTYLTGIKHGTISVRACGELIEVTTFRTDGNYSDNRRPDTVKFVSSLKEDLKRRDFTVNAMAYNEESGIIDLFGGIEDINNKLIRAVGNPEERFNEDALRILRALRFASKLNFEIEPETKKAILKCKNLLNTVAVERVFVELIKILLGDGVERVLLDFKEVFFTIIPELKSCDGFLQKSKYHDYDVYTHIVKSVANSKKDKLVRLSLLLHDVGKPECFSEDDEGVGHFFGHQKKSAIITERVLERLKADNKTVKTVTKLVLLHDTRTELTRPEIKEFLRLNWIDFTYRLLDVKIGDAKAHNAMFIENRIKSIERMKTIATEIIDNNECYTLKQLAVDGNDLKTVGFKGEKIKFILEKLLNLVINGKIENEKEVLLKSIKNDGRITK